MLVSPKDIGEVAIKATPPPYIDNEFAHADRMVDFANRHLSKAVEYIRRINPTNIEGTLELMQCIVRLQNLLHAIKAR